MITKMKSKYVWPCNVFFNFDNSVDSPQCLLKVIKILFGNRNVYSHHNKLG